MTDEQGYEIIDLLRKILAKLPEQIDKSFLVNSPLSEIENSCHVQYEKKTGDVLTRMEKVIASDN